MILPKGLHDRIMANPLKSTVMEASKAIAITTTADCLTVTGFRFPMRNAQPYLKSPIGKNMLAADVDSG